MADITMCSGKGCPFKDSCYRYTATPNKFRQSYFLQPPIIKDEEVNCEMYWGDQTNAIWKQLKDITDEK